MANLSPKIEIINHFDNLIHRIDIHIDQTIEKYKENQVLGEFKRFSVKNRDFYSKKVLKIQYFDSKESPQNNKCETVNEWSESTKVIDYLNQIRQRTIDELRKAQEDSLEHLKSKSLSDLNQIKQSKDVEEMKSRLFVDKFYFQVLFKPRDKQYQDSWAFSLFTIVVDFYLSPSDISLKEYFINNEINELENIYSDSILTIDEKFFLIYSIFEEFCKNLKTQQYPSHLMSFHKQDLLYINKDIRRIIIDLENLQSLRKVNFNCSSSYLLKLEELDIYLYVKRHLERVSIEGLSSLKSLSLKLESIEQSSFVNLNSLKKLNLNIKSEINNDLLTKLFEICPNIEVLIIIYGRFSNINFVSFVNLKKLRLFGVLLDDFNFDLFKNIRIQLEELCIHFSNEIDNESISKLLFSHYFPNLLCLDISHTNIISLEKTLFDGFPMLQSLYVSSSRIETIDRYTFSNLKNLKSLSLNHNRLTELDPEIFSCLGNLEQLNLSSNELRHFDSRILDYVVNIKRINLENNPIMNQEIENRFKQMNINYTLGYYIEDYF